MAKFAGDGQNRGGGTVTGEMEAPSEAFVLAQLRREQVAPIKIRKKAGDLAIRLPFQGDKKVTQKSLAIFTRQFATMIDAGLPLVQCLDILGMQTMNQSLLAAYLRREIALDDAVGRSNDPDEFRNLLSTAQNAPQGAGRRA